MGKHGGFKILWLSKSLAGSSPALHTKQQSGDNMPSVKLHFFDGFADSIHGLTIQNMEEILFLDNEGEDQTPENFWEHIHYPTVFQAYAKDYVSCLKHDLKHSGLPLDSMTFDRLKSPREYNFRTDEIYTNLSEEDIKKLWVVVDRETLARVVKDRFSSYSGFVSFYSNELPVMENKALGEWDSNEVGVLLEAVILDHTDYSDEDIAEGILVSGVIGEFIDKVMDEEGKELCYNFDPTANTCPQDK